MFISLGIYIIGLMVFLSFVFAICIIVSYLAFFVCISACRRPRLSLPLVRLPIPSSRLGACGVPRPSRRRLRRRQRWGGVSEIGWTKGLLREIPSLWSNKIFVKIVFMKCLLTN